MENPNQLRKNAVNKLESMMNYPGRFPILVLGETGTGKTHFINEICKRTNEFTGELIHINAALTEPTIEYWQSVLERSNSKYLVIDDVEKLSKLSQELLFEALSTENGQYGFGEKNLIIRLIFTSTFPIKKIREDRRFLEARFFDRISQFVVEFPNFDRTQRYVYDDFKTTWNKMFEVNGVLLAECPKCQELEVWLESIADRMYGNFRDLDKIVVNWHLQQIKFDLNEKDKRNIDEMNNKILSLIKEEFDILIHNPSQKIAEDNTFIFDEDLEYGDLLNNFRLKLKKWALAINNNDIHKTAKMLGVSYRTMERWK